REPRAIWTHVQGDPDWASFFSPDSPWKRAASGIQVFSLEPGYVSDASDAELMRTKSGLADRDISILVPVGPVAVEGGDQCGKTEGYDDSKHTTFIIDKLTKVHITPKYIALDGPLWSHYAKGQNQCG